MWINKAVRESRRKNYLAHLGALLAIICAAGPLGAGGESIALTGEKIRISISARGPGQRELIEIRDGETWAAALDTQGSVTRIRVAGKDRGCILQSARVIGADIVTNANCGNGTVERDLRLGPDEDMIAVKVRFTPNAGATLSSVEDRMSFAPFPRPTDTPRQGPLDFVWSQDIKASQDDLVPHWAFKAPTVIFQQARIFAAIVPRVDLLTASGLHNAPPALDLDVTSNNHAWFSYGIVPTKPTQGEFVPVPKAISLKRL